MGDVRGRAKKNNNRSGEGVVKQRVTSPPLPPASIFLLLSPHAPHASPPLLPLGYTETETTATQAAVSVETVTVLI